MSQDIVDLWKAQTKLADQMKTMAVLLKDHGDAINSLADACKFDVENMAKVIMRLTEIFGRLEALEENQRFRKTPLN